MRILVAVDGSDHSVRAVRHAITLAGELARPPDLHLLYADAPMLAAAARTIGEDATARYHAGNGQLAMRRGQRLLEQAGLDYEGHVLIGDPAEVLIRFMRRPACDLVIMGSHGRSALGKVLLGSVASKVLAHCRTPVTIVR